MCGPSTKIKYFSGFESSINIYSLLIGDPGCGKTPSFANIITPVIDAIFAEHGSNIAIENYTTAGLQGQQKRNEGSGLITTDGGQRLLPSINIKQNKSEGERALLCKMWDGRGW